MTIKIPYDFGDIVYLKNDPGQKTYEFVGFEGRPGSILYILDYMGEEITVYDFQTSKDKDILKALEGKKDDEDD